MNEHKIGIPRFVNYENLIWMSIGLAALAWILDSLLDSLIFHQGTPIEQIISPDNQEIGVRLIFGLIFVTFGVFIQFDITRFKRAENALKIAVINAENEKNKTKAIIEAVGDGIILQDTDYKIVYQNQIQNDLYGNHTGEYCYKAYEGRDTICEDCPIELSFKDGKIHRTERNIVTDNRELHIELTGSSLRDSTGKIIGGVKVVRDISEHKQAEKEKDRFLKAFASSTEGITIADEKDKFIYVNEAYAMIFGYNQKELIGDTWRKITPPDIIAPTEGGLSCTMHNKDIGIFYGEVPGLKKDGTIIPTEVRGKGIWDENGNYQGHICIVRDISERKRIEEKLRKAHDELETRVRERTAELTKSNETLKAEIIERQRAERALRDSEEKFRNIYAQSPIGIEVYDSEGKLLDANKACLDIFGLSAVEEVKGFRLFDDPNITDEIKEKLRTGKIIKYEALFDFEIVKKYNLYKTIKPGVIYLDVLITPIGQKENTVSGYLVQVQDITGRRLAEEKTREQAAFLGKAQDAIYVQDMEHRIIYCNKSTECLYHWGEGEFISKNANELLYKDTEELPRLIEAWKSVLEKGEWMGELCQVTKEGNEIIVESRWTLMHDSEGKPKSILVINTDITGKKKLEVQLLRAQRLESIGTLASGIAHDINNVLLPIMLSLELLKEKFTDDESQKLIDILERSAKRGTSLIKQVQSFARGIEGERVALQAGHLISEIRQIAIETFPRSIEITTSTPNDLWVISGNATQLHQVIMNLCVNARDAMPDGGILNISAENLLIDEDYAHVNIEAKVGPYIVIIVSDTGTGIPHEIMDRIFEPFFTTKGPGKGTGLGLSTALGIVKSHGGFISVYSEVGKGTAFKVYLPAITTIETQKAEERQPELSKGHGESALVVDDEPQIQQITKEILEKYGYQVITANNGDEAVRLYNDNIYKIKFILMDMMMPVMDGLDSIREIRKANPEVKIIAVSGLTEKDKLERIAQTHVHAFLTKPYTTEKLLKTISEVISTK